MYENLINAQDYLWMAIRQLEEQDKKYPFDEFNAQDNLALKQALADIQTVDKRIGDFLRRKYGE